MQHFLGVVMGAFVILSAAQAEGDTTKAEAPFWQGIEVGASGSGSLVKFTTTEDNEINKKGFGLLGTFELGFPWEHTLVRAGVGYFAAYTTGINSITNIEEKFAATGLAVNLGIDYRILDKWSVGLSTLHFIAPGATLRFGDSARIRAVLFIGPRVSYRVPTLGAGLDKWVGMEFFAERLFEVNIAGNALDITSLGIAVRAPLGAGQLPVFPPPYKNPLQVVPTPAEHEAMGVREDIHLIVVRFTLASARFTPKEQERLRHIAALLHAQGTQWQEVLVTGHGDSSGKKTRTQFFSNKRAQGARALLLAAGVDAGRVRAEGKGDRAMLPGLSRYAPQQRRVELVIVGSSAAVALAEQLRTHAISLLPAP
jgi:outer membrane protein OmpA-like peptidoglycan-associated protein